MIDLRDGWVNYEAFGAQGDGVTNDMPAICEAHDYPNAHGLGVKTTPDATYYSGYLTVTGVKGEKMTIEHNYPILEFDPEREAIIEARQHLKPVEGMPEHCVICFFQDVIDHFVEQGLAQEIYVGRSETGPHPVYKLQLDLDGPVTLCHPGIGGPMAAARVEQAIALGCKKFVACGGAGVLDREIQVGHLVVPTAAIRDEGTSYHYLPPGREVSPSPEAVKAIETVLTRHHVNYLLAKTWTTDGVFRETRTKTALRKAEGCLTVEMEAASMFAVAQFRGVPLGQILYGGDNLDAEQWDKRAWQDCWPVRERLVGLAAEACLMIGD